MRVADLFTITNQYSEEVCFWIALTSDDSYRIAYQDKLGWLKKGESVRIEVDLEEVKIGFRQGRLPISGWYAEPVKVKTNRSVTLTEEKKIEQPGEEFANPDKTRAVNFLDETMIQMHDIGRQIVVAALGKIPNVGGAVAGIVGAIWPEMKPKVEDLIQASEERMKSWVHGRIQEYDRSFLENTMGGLRENLTEYLNARSPAQRGQKFNICLAAFNAAKAHFVKKNYTPGTISLTFDLATMHLALLRERVVHPREILGDDTDVENHKKTLKNTIKDYQDFIKNIAIPGEMKWREKMMAITHGGPDIIGQAFTVVRDHATREVHVFTKSANRGQGGNHTVLFEYYKSQALTSYRLALEANIGDPAQLWTLLDPDQANTQPIPLNRVVWVGPCTGLVNKANNEHGASGHLVNEDRPGLVKKILVREYNEIDYIQLFYDDHTGGGVGNQKGGVEHVIDLPDGVFVHRVESWWDWQLSGIKFHFTNGKDTGKLGDRTGMGQHYQVASYPGHRLSTIRVDDRKSAMWFGFSPLLDYYKPKQLQ